MKAFATFALAALLVANVHAGDAAVGATKAKPTPAQAGASATAGAADNVPAPGSVSTGGNTGGAGSTKSTSISAVQPKKPKCPDPTKCPAEKAIAQ